MGNKSGLNYDAPDIPFAAGVTLSLLMESMSLTISSRDPLISFNHTNSYLGATVDVILGHSGSELNASYGPYSAGLLFDKSGDNVGLAFHYGYSRNVGESFLGGSFPDLSLSDLWL